MLAIFKRKHLIFCFTGETKALVRAEIEKLNNIVVKFLKSWNENEKFDEFVHIGRYTINVSLKDNPGNDHALKRRN